MARASYDMWSFEIYPLGIEKGEKILNMGVIWPKMFLGR